MYLVRPVAAALPIVLLMIMSTQCCSEERIKWTESNIVGSPEPPAPYHVQQAYPGLKFQNPVEVKVVPNSNLILVLQVNGKLYVFDDDPNASDAREILDLGSDRSKMSAFGFGLHPRFPERPELYVVYAPNHSPIDNGSHLSKFTVTDTDSMRIDPKSERRLISWRAGGHNGSTIQFDDDGLLYFSIGDGARPLSTRRIRSWSRSIGFTRFNLSIDIDDADDELGYRIPKDNPFVNVPGARGEIWAFGFRNPWRFSIDSATGKVFCGDVGWELWESVFQVRKGGNYGWSLFEGPQPIRSDLMIGPAPITKPVVTYSHSVGQSVTGGFVYHGERFPKLDGVYLYGDYVSGLMWGLHMQGDDVTANPLIAETGLPIITFSQNHRGDILVVSYDGAIHRLVRNPLVDQPIQFPKELSQTGLFRDVASLKPAPGVYQYQLSARSHLAGVDRTFHVAVPGAQSIQIGRLPRNWKYPRGRFSPGHLVSCSVNKPPVPKR